MTTLFFTATGNSLAVAQRCGGRMLSIPALLREGLVTHITDHQGVGLVCPVHYGEVPAPVVELFEKITINTPYFFCILTYGKVPGRAVEHVKRLAKKAGKPLDFVDTVKMPDNNFTFLNVEKEARKFNWHKCFIQLDSMYRNLGFQRHLIKRTSLLNHLVGLVQKFLPRPENPASRFSVELEKCNGCRICEKVCPTLNITSSTADRHPIWGKDCLLCTACYHNCPQGAIRYAGEKSRFTYRNPDVPLDVLIEKKCSRGINRQRAKLFNLQ